MPPQVALAMTATERRERLFLIHPLERRAYAEYQVLNDVSTIFERMSPLLSMYEQIKAELKVPVLVEGAQEPLTAAEVFDAYQTTVLQQSADVRENLGVDFLWYHSNLSVLAALEELKVRVDKGINILLKPLVSNTTSGTFAMGLLQQQVSTSDYTSYINDRTSYLRSRQVPNTSRASSSRILVDTTDSGPFAGKLFHGFIECADHWESQDATEKQYPSCVKEYLESWLSTLTSTIDGTSLDKVKQYWAEVSQKMRAPLDETEDPQAISDKLKAAIAATVRLRTQSLVPALEALSSTRFERISGGNWAIK